jgi:hypothetical protein
VYKILYVGPEGQGKNKKSQNQIIKIIKNKNNNKEGTPPLRGVPYPVF